MTMPPRILMAVTIATVLAVSPDIGLAATLGVVIEDPGEHAARCGVNKQELLDLAKLTLRNNRVQPVDRAKAFLWVQPIVINALPNARNEFCAGNLRVSVEALGKVIDGSEFKNPEFGKDGIGTISLCQVSKVVIGPISQFAPGMSMYEENLIKQCLGSLDY
jgi:hypothetical protein